SIASAQPVNAGNYTVTVTNNFGSITSSVAVLTLNVAPFITSEPQSVAVAPAQPAQFTVTANGSSPLGYQWQFGGGAIPGATDSSYSIASAQPVNAGNYTVTVTNNFGSITSSVAVLALNVAPSITSQPQSVAVAPAQPAQFTVTASGTSPLNYQWRFGGGTIPGATDSSYSIASAQPVNAGNYTVAVTNNFVSVT